MTSTSHDRKWRVFAPLGLFLGTLLLRLPLVGGPPFTDDGTYVCSAALSLDSSQGMQILPVHAYPSLLASVAAHSSTPFLPFRVADAFVAAGASVMLFLFLSRWAHAAAAFVAAASWSLADNLPLFAEAGFKNSITAATVVYLAALWFLTYRTAWAPFWAGLLIPAAVILREPFLPIVIVSLYLAFALHGMRGLLLHIGGLAVGGSVLLGWTWLYRGSPGVVLERYRDLAMVYEEMVRLGRDVRAERWTSLKQSARATMWLAPTALLGLGWLIAPGRDQRVAKGLAVLLFLPPLPEILGKLCVPYHWAQLLLGVAFLGAMGLNWLSSVMRSVGNRWVTIVTYCALAWLIGELDGRSVYQAYRDGLRLSREFAPVMVWGDWNHPAVARSAYLEQAKYIRDNTSPDDRVVVSGAYEVLYPLSGRLPPSAFTCDLTFMSCMRYPERRPELVEQLRQHPPRLVIETLRFPVELKDYWPDFDERYCLAKEFPLDESKHYGGHGARVWELIDRGGAGRE